MKFGYFCDKQYIKIITGMVIEKISEYIKFLENS